MPRLQKLSLFSFLAIGACGKLPGFHVNEKADVFQQVYERNDKIDILFIVDNSASMSEEQANLASSFGNFIANFTSKNLKYHIGVTTTDTQNAASWWNGTAVYNAGCNYNPNPRPYGTAGLPRFPNAGKGSLLAFFGNDRFITEHSVDPVGQFGANVGLGVCGSGGEAGLQAAVEFFKTSKTQAGGWNENFLRSEAYLAIIVVSDEDEGVGNGNGTYLKNIAGAEETRINEFTTAIRALKSSEEQSRIRFDAIVAPSAAQCPSIPFPDSVGDTYMKVAQLMGGKSANICTDFSAALNDLGVDLVEAATRFKLKQIPNGPIEVSVNGQVVPESEVNGWTFIEETLEVEFHGDAIPPEAATISVNYTPLRPV